MKNTEMFKLEPIDGRDEKSSNFFRFNRSGGNNMIAVGMESQFMHDIETQTFADDLLKSPDDISLYWSIISEDETNNSLAKNYDSVLDKNHPKQSSWTHKYEEAKKDVAVQTDTLQDVGQGKSVEDVVAANPGYKDKAVQVDAESIDTELKHVGAKVVSVGCQTSDLSAVVEIVDGQPSGTVGSTPNNQVANKDDNDDDDNGTCQNCLFTSLDCCDCVII